MMAIIYPWVYNYTTFQNRASFHVTEEKDKVTIECNLPGIAKEEIELDYHGDKLKLHIFVKDKVDKDIWFTTAIDEENIEARLDLGVLKITAPILNSSKRIQIK